MQRPTASAEHAWPGRRVPFRGNPRVAPRLGEWPGNPRWFRWAVVLYLLVAVTKIQEGIPALVAMSPAKFAGAALIPAALVYVPRHRWLSLSRARTAQWAAVLGVLAVLGVPFALWPGGAFQFITSQYWKTLLFFGIAAVAVTDLRAMRAVVLAFLAGSSFALVRVLLGVASSEDGRAFVGEAFDPNESASLFLVTLPFCVFLINRIKWGRIPGMVLAVALILGIARTGSRGGLVGLAVLGLWYIYRARPGRRVVYAFVVPVVGVIGLAAASDQVSERLASLTNPAEDYNFTSREGRKQVWTRGVGYMLRRPILGVGIGNFGVAEGVISGKVDEGFGIKYSAAHNSFVQIGAELGVLGLIAFVAMLWTAARGCRRVARLPSHWLPPGPRRSLEDQKAAAETAESALVAFAVGGFFLSLAHHTVTFFLVAFALGVRMGAMPGRMGRPRPRRRVNRAS